MSELPHFKALVLPSAAVRDVYLRAIRARRVKWNYAVVYGDDRGGFGLQMAVVDWLTEGRTYICR